MPGPHHATPTSRPHRSVRHEGIRLLAVVLAIIALVLTSSALNLVTRPAAAADGSPSKAVVVAGPVHGYTDRFKGYAAAIADAAEARGMEVVRIFHPYAPAARVKAKAQGADLFVYVGHGNGWPSGIGTSDEDTKNGLGLDAAAEEDRGPNTVVYKGADWLRDNLRLAPDAVVILSHLSYASGNASSGMPIPGRGVAVARVDNFANGFLSIGARVVWALGWQPGADVVKALHDENATMDAVFMTRYREGGGPLNGWIDHDAAYYDSARIPGARIHLDPDPKEGYLRAITGDLSFTTTAWRDAKPQPVDTTVPVVSGLGARQSAATITAAGIDVPVFTPNGDGISDTIGIGYHLSEGAFLEVKVKQGGRAIRRWTSWAQAGVGTVAWNGRRDGGGYAAEGKYNVYLTPTDRAGNRGQPKLIGVKLLNSLRSPTVRPPLFWARDGDKMAQGSALKAKLTRDARVSWVIRDRRGKVIRRNIGAKPRKPGEVRFMWDGRDDAGRFVPDGLYSARVRVTRPGGSYAHDLTVRHMPFKAWTPSWTRVRGDMVTLTITTAEPLRGKPVVTANQRGIGKYTVPPRLITRLNATEYKVVINTRPQSKPGMMKVRVVGTDRAGGTNAKLFALHLK